MDSSSSSDDGEPKVSTVFSSTSSGNSASKSTFDSIVFTIPKKDPPSPTTPTLFTPPPVDPYMIATPTVAMSKTNSMVSMLADDLQSGDPSGTISNPVKSPMYDEFPLSSQGDSEQPKSAVTAHVAICVYDSSDDMQPSPPLPAVVQPPPTPSLGVLENTEIFQKLERLELDNNEGSKPAQPELTLQPQMLENIFPETSTVETVPAHVPAHVPPAELNVESLSSLSLNYTNQPEFPTVGMIAGKSGDIEDTFSWREYTLEDSSYQAWIPSEETKKVLVSISSEVAAGTHVPDKEDMTMPGIILADDLADKVGVNVRRIFGSPEAMRRKTFTADSVSQDDNGLRELIKLGCYRAAINLTKRLLVLYGQGPGKVGHYSKHTPHSLQIWFLRISLLVRIREFSTAESEVEAFKSFEKPDMYYEYYPDSLGSSDRCRRGSMVPFHFRVLAAEIPQYMRKFNDTINKLYDILFRVQQMLANLEKGLSEDGSIPAISKGVDVQKSIKIWKKREVRVLYSLSNSSLFAKDYHNAFNFLSQLCQKDSAHLPQLKSALGRLFLQHGDIVTAETYFHTAAEIRSDSDLDQVDSLVDSAVLAISQNQYGDAVEFLKQALMLQPENFMITNNLAVCHLYLGNVKESLALMETTVKQNMPQSLQENVILNLCSIYELENSDGSKKLGLLKLISEYKGDGINLASLKLPDLI